ncbi:MAG: type 4a pilus biogenesis protein PilO [Pirellulales bacterium]
MGVIDEETRRFGRMLHYAGVLATVLSVWAGYKYIHAPTVESINATSAQIDELMLSVQNATIIREQHRIVSAKLHEVTTQIANLQQRVPTNDDSGEFLNQLSQLAHDEQVSITAFNPEKPEPRAGYTEMYVTLKGTGSFRSICMFVDKLSKLPRLSKVKDFTLSADEGSTEYPLSATLVIYFGLRGNQAESSQEGRNG